MLVRAGDQVRVAKDRIDLVTTFRLAHWRTKGLPTVLEALRRLNDDRVRLTICGSGPVTADLTAAIADLPWCRLVVDATDEVLADLLAEADLFVLATRTHPGTSSHGEGFGLVLVEAQLAGTAVVAPAHGGSGDAFQPGLTGAAPADESVEALVDVLGPLLADERRRSELSGAAGAWARARFDPTSHSLRIAHSLVPESVVDKVASRPPAVLESV
jgi:glycosyltransferase involved in cell wall biosynthesis